MRTPRKLFINGKPVNLSLKQDAPKKNLDVSAGAGDGSNNDTVAVLGVEKEAPEVVPAAAGTDAERASSARDAIPQVKKDEAVIAQASTIITRVRRRITKK